MNRHIRQTLLPLLAALIWGSAFVAQSVGADHIGAFTFNALRSMIAVPALGVVIFFMHRNDPQKASEKGERAMLWRGGTCCGVVLFLASALQQLGLRDTGAGKAGFITALYIVLVPIFSLLLRRRVALPVWIAVAITVTGLYFLCITDGFSILPSDFLILLCAVAFAVHILVIDHFAPHVDCVKMSCVQFMVAAVLSAICAILTEEIDPAAIRACAWSLFYTGILSSGVAFTLQIVAQRDANPTLVSLLMSMESVFAVVSGALFLHEEMTSRELFGCALMLAGILLSQIPLGKKNEGAVTNG